MKKLIFIFLIGFAQIGFGQIRIQQGYSTPERKIANTIDTAEALQTTRTFPIIRACMGSTGEVAFDFACPTGSFKLCPVDKNYHSTMSQQIFTIYPYYCTLSDKEKEISLDFLKSWIIDEENKLIKKQR